MKFRFIPIGLLFTIFLLNCSTTKETSLFQRLTEYEGRFEYLGSTTLDLLVSELDTTLYAIIDNAKYPLKYIEKDSFINIQNAPVVFLRNHKNEVNGYIAGENKFDLITRDFDKPEMLPRKELFKNPDLYTYQPPKQITDGITTGNIVDELENPKPIIEMVKQTIMGAYPDVHSILIYKNNKLVLEEYFYGYDQNTMHQLRSAGKSLKGGILGIAIDKGFVKSEQDQLLPYFKSKYSEIKNLDELKKQIRIKDFLMYRHGMDCENDNPKSQGNEQLMMQSEDWVKHILDLPMVKKPGKSSSYCTGCSLTINSLIEIATDQKIEDFAKKHLFDPLGISNYKWTFEPNPASINTFNQLYITPRDLLKLAILYKNQGLWKGQQIISKDWINKTFTMEKGDYGFFWEHKYFVIDGKEYNSYLATGNGGQKINIWPELDMITIFTGGNYNSYAIYGKSTPPNEMIPKYILKSME
ncbi:MAG: serine hydrolase [Saprospiraceae bacterium]|nr:serine hydrolase [Saprospiraceae bacterium]